MIARYDLAEDIASFDYYNWQALAAARGATEIVFGVERVKTTKWPETIVRRRFETIIAPGPALLGLPSRVGSDGVRLQSAHMRELVGFVRAGGAFPRLKSVKPKGAARYTVTLRQDQRIPERNSNVPAWREFAAEIGARVIEDFDVEPIGIHDRFALYAGAEMNFGVSQGPNNLNVLSDNPTMTFACERAAGAFENSGVPFGSQFPWFNASQRLIWEPDDLPVLRRNFALWRQSRGAGDG